MENERTREFRFCCVNREDEDMWVALGSVCGFLVIDGEEDDLVVVDGVTAATTLEGYWLLVCLQQRRMVDDSVVEIRRQCCWHDDDLAGARVKMVKIGGRGIARDHIG
ncbi:hypothetical protein V8G54_021655 [Vigna mungo]|uniref:Uncharacterized protein n=1 Tax=Vigna mungo TaxID=3915 RepID=A0AAQ3NDU2_VIGMU